MTSCTSGLFEGDHTNHVSHFSISVNGSSMSLKLVLEPHQIPVLNLVQC